MKTCKGCGVLLQDKNKQEPGYTPKLINTICQRCYRLLHYDDLPGETSQLIDSDLVLRTVEKLDALLLWVVDILDLPAAFGLAINRYFPDSDILLVLTKSDLLPATYSTAKLDNFLQSQLKEAGIKVNSYCVLGNHGKSGLKELIASCRKLAKGSPLVLLGNANSGKSTLLKALSDQEVTISRYPGTTLAISEYQGNGFKIYDTPGLLNKGSVLQYLDTEHLARIIPKKMKHLAVFQISSDQSFAIGGLVRLDALGVKKATVVFYQAEGLKIHRGKAELADELWDKHYGGLLWPVIGELKGMKSYNYQKEYEKIDICIWGLGFVAISGQVNKLIVKVNEQVNITVRKGMI